MICWGSANLPTPSFGRDGRGTRKNLSISTTTSDSESEFGAETSPSISHKKEVLSDAISASPHGIKQVLQQLAGIKVGTSQTTSNATSSSLSSSTVAGSNFSAASGDAPEPSSLQGHILPLPNLRIFTMAELKAATENFRSDWLLGDGGFGKVYKGWIPEWPNRNGGESGRGGDGLVIAIKRSNSETGSSQRFEEWRAEVDIQGRLSHPNLVKLLGYCSEDKELLLVYEYMQKGSLQHHLFGRGATVQPLPWDTRLNILIGAARGLAFLHTPNVQVIYRDFKPSNIMLDSSYNAKITDFGLAITGPTESEPYVTTTVMGTCGYAAPEYVATGHLYVKSDVFAFGVVLIEMLTGLSSLARQRPVEQHHLIDWIIPYLVNKRKLKSIMDSKLEGKYPLENAYQIAKLSLKCLASEPKNRPSMEEVLNVLEKANVSNAERHKEPKTLFTRPDGQGQRPVQLPTPP